MRNPATEEQLWSYLVQLTSALRCIHGAGLAARPGCLMPSKVKKVTRCDPMGSGVQSAASWLALRQLPASLRGLRKGCLALEQRSSIHSSSCWSPAVTLHHGLKLCPTSPLPCSIAVTVQVLVTSNGRVRIGSLGVPEVLTETAGYQDVPQASLRACALDCLGWNDAAVLASKTGGCQDVP